MSTEGFRAPEVMLITGMTYRQLDYCVSTSLVTPSLDAGVGSGNRRMFNASDVALLRVVNALRGMGVRGRLMRAAMELTREHEGGGMLILPNDDEPYVIEQLGELKDADHAAYCVIDLGKFYTIDSEDA